MWQWYQLILRLLTPTHISWNKIGNVQRTRPYITGRALWGALTARLTRDQHATPTAANYQAPQQLAFSGLCYAPGATPTGQTTYESGHYGIWHLAL